MAKKKRVSFKNTAKNMAYANGLRRCPCCDVQLVWVPNIERVQKNLATADHIVPRSIGGADSANNIYIMCHDCNSDRGNQCFVKYVTERGVSKNFATELYRKAHGVTLQHIIFQQFLHNSPDRDQAYLHNKKQKAKIRKVVKNYVDFFGDYLPEFELLQRIL